MRVAIGLGVAAVASLLPFGSAADALPDAVRAGLLATTPLAALGFAVAAVAGVARIAAVGVPAVAAFGVHVIGYNPFGDVDCASICRDVPPVGANLLATRTSIVATTLLGVAACLVGLGLTVARSRQYTWMGFVVLGVGLGVRSAALPVVAVALVAAWLGLDRLRLRRTRDAVSRLARDLSGGTGRTDVRFAVPQSDRWIDAAGHDVSTEHPNAPMLVIPDAAGPAIALTIPPRADAAEIATGLSSGTRLALTNARLFAVARWRLTQLRAGQRRVVAAADAERRRIERDLHDGAQQRLVSAALHLRVARSSTDESAYRHLDDAEEQIRRALDALRRLAHGLVPASLVDEGLEAALRELCAGSAALEVDGPLEPSTEAALAAFTLAAATLGAAQDATISVASRDGSLSVRIALTVAVPDLEARLSDAIDRIGAAGGDVKFTDSGGQSVEAVIPCG